MLLTNLEMILGAFHKDERGTLSYVNDFNMESIKRFYIISHPDEKIIRAWQGHKIENKWFYCVGGSFIINTIEIDNWNNPSSDLKVSSYQINVEMPAVLHVKGGFVTGIKANKPASSLLVFSDMQTSDSKKDEFRFDRNLWFNWNNV